MMTRVALSFVFMFLQSSFFQASFSDSSTLDVYGCNGDVMFENLLKGKSIHLKQHDGKTALHRAAISGNDEIIAIIIDVGGIVDEVDNKGLTPLIYAIGTGLADPVIVLVENGADINKRFEHGRTALFYVYSKAEVAQVLIEAGADVNAVDNFGKSPLWYARKRSETEDNIFELIKLLENFGAKALSFSDGIVSFSSAERERVQYCILLRDNLDH